MILKAVESFYTPIPKARSQLLSIFIQRKQGNNTRELITQDYLFGKCSESITMALF